MYSPLALVLSNALVQVPWMAVFSLAALGIGAFGLAQFQVAGFGRLVLALAVALWTFEMLGQLLAAIFHNPLCGMGVGLILWFAFFLVSGVFISEASIQWPARALMFASPFRWILPAVVHTEFHGTRFAPGTSSAVYYGETGDEVLDAISSIFTVFSATDRYLEGVAFTAAIGVGAKILFALVFHYRSRASCVPKPPKPDTKRAGVSRDGAREMRTESTQPSTHPLVRLDFTESANASVAL